MSIRIRVYPQPGSVGLRRKRAARVQQQHIMRQQYQLHRQQELVRQQQLQMSYGFGLPSGFGSAYSSGYGMGTTPGYGSYAAGYGSHGYGSPIGSYGSYGSYGSSVSQQACASPYTSPLQSSFPWAGSSAFSGAGLLSRLGFSW